MYIIKIPNTFWGNNSEELYFQYEIYDPERKEYIAIGWDSIESSTVREKDDDEVENYLKKNVRKNINDYANRPKLSDFSELMQTVCDGLVQSDTEIFTFDHNMWEEWRMDIDAKEEFKKFCNEAKSLNEFGESVDVYSLNEIRVNFDLVCRFNLIHTCLV